MFTKKKSFMIVNLKQKIDDLSDLNNMKLFDIIDFNSFLVQIEKNTKKLEYNRFNYFTKTWLIQNIKRKGVFSSKTGLNMIYDSKLYKESSNVYFGFGHKWMLYVITDKGMIFSKCKVPSDTHEFTEEVNWNHVYLKIVEGCKLEINISNPLLKFPKHTFTHYIEESFGGFLKEVYYSLNNHLINSKHIKDLITRTELKRQLKQNDHERKRKEKLENSKTLFISKFDINNNGTIDIIEDQDDFNLLLKKNQTVIQEKGKEFNQNYTHQFIKVDNYLKQKRENLQLIFNWIKTVKNENELNVYSEILQQEIHTYNLLLFNSLTLIVSLIDDDLLTFYKIYEKFDELNIYNSNWENEVSEKLTNLGNKLTTINNSIKEVSSNINGLMFEIRDMGKRIVNSINDLSYVTEESSKVLNSRLEEVKSSIDTNNLLTLIQTYQSYKVNKNTKSLR